MMLVDGIIPNMRGDDFVCMVILKVLGIWKCMMKLKHRKLQKAGRILG